LEELAMDIPRLSLLRISRRCVVTVALALAAVSVVLWVASVAGSSIGLFSLGSDTSVRFERGRAEFRHVYDHDFAPPVPAPQWHTAALSRGWVVPTGGPSTVPNFAFSSGHVIGITGTPNSGLAATVSPARYWLLYVPLWATMLPGIVAATWIVVRWERHRQERAARRRGFEVLAGAPPLPGAQA
jgi:hypothetical protein